jgi:hypothetical protein
MDFVAMYVKRSVSLVSATNPLDGRVRDLADVKVARASGGSD